MERTCAAGWVVGRLVDGRFGGGLPNVSACVRRARACVCGWLRGCKGTQFCLRGCEGTQAVVRPGATYVSQCRGLAAAGPGECQGLCSPPRRAGLVHIVSYGLFYCAWVRPTEVLDLVLWTCNLPVPAAAAAAVPAGRWRVSQVRATVVNHDDVSCCPSPPPVSARHDATRHDTTKLRRSEFVVSSKIWCLF